MVQNSAPLGLQDFTLSFQMNPLPAFSSSVSSLFFGTRPGFVQETPKRPRRAEDAMGKYSKYIHQGA